jgi:outer membrane protein OmpA-like peptidoglycan-associated protein
MNTIGFSRKRFIPYAAYGASLFIFLIVIAEIIPVESALSAPNSPSETAPQTWPSLTYHSPQQRAYPSVSGEEFGYFPSIGTGHSITPLDDMPIAGISPRQWTPVRFNKGLHPGLATTVLGDVYLADDRPLVTAEAAQLLASTAMLLEQDPDTALALEAYCDERGTEAYSIVTGQQWVSIIDRRLQEMRVNKVRMISVSYGTQQPSCRDTSAACWEDNLRMKWSVRLLSPITSQRGCLIRLKIVSPGSLLGSTAIQTNQSFLRRIQQGERSSSRLVPFSSTR